MNPFKIIKDKLLYGLQDSLLDLIDENLTTVLELKKNGVKYAMNRIMESKSFKDINLLTYAVMLKSPHKDVKEKIEHKNFEIYKECFNINNGITFQKVIQKYFEAVNSQNLKVINSINDIEYNIIPLTNKKENVENFEVIDVNKKLYLNPYTHSEVLLQSENRRSKINTTIDSSNRILRSIVNIDTFEQPQLLYVDDKSYSGLTNHFSLNQINKFEVEFALFHELAHAAVTMRNKIGREDESVSDMCGTLKVIKNNNMSLEQAIDYIDYRVTFRSSDNTLSFHSQKFTETDIENNADVRIHSTQLSLLALKHFIQDDYEFIKSLDTNEELILSSNIARSATAKSTIYEVKQRHFDNRTLYEEISLDSWMQNEKFIACFEKLAQESDTTKEELFENLKRNISGDTDKVFDVMTAYYRIAEPEELKNLTTYSLYIGDIYKNGLIKDKEAAIDVDLKANFSEKDLKVVIEKQKKSRTNLFE